MDKRKRGVRHFFHNKSIFTKTLLMLFSMSLVSVIVMFLLVNYIVTKNQSTRIYDMSVSQLQRAGRDMDTRLVLIENSMQQFLTNSDVVSLMENPNQNDMDRNNRVLSSLTGFAYDESLVKATTFYLPTTEQVYSSYGFCIPKSEAADQTAIDAYLNVRQESQREEGTSGTICFFSEERYFLGRDYYAPDFSGVVLFEVDLARMSQLLHGEKEEWQESYLVMDKQYNCLVGEITDAVTWGNLSEMISQEDWSGEQVHTISDYYMFQSNETNLIYGFRQDDEGAVMDYRSVPLTVLLPFFAAYVCFSIFYSYYITRTIYKPINRLMQITSDEEERSDPKKKRNSNEMDYLEMAFQNTLGENQQHKELLASISHDMTEQMFRSILTGKTVDNAYITSTLEGIGLSDYLHGRYMAMAGRLLIDKNRELTTVESGLYQRSLIGILDELGGDDYMITPFFIDKDMLAVVCCFQEESSLINMKHCITDIVDSVNQFTDHLPYSVVFGKGKVCNEIPALRNSFQEAVKEVQYLCYISEEPESEMPVLDKMTDDYDKKYFTERGRQVAEAACKDRRENAEKLAFAMVHEISECSEENRKMYLEVVVDIMVEKMLESHITKDEIKKMQLTQIIDEAEAAESNEARQEMINQFFVATIKAIHTGSRKNRYKYVESAKNYISEHYSDGNLSLNEVSEAIGISSPYLSGVFTEVNKGGFSSYLSNFRVEQAKHFLEDTTQSVAEIGYQCGFNSAQSFSRVFKKCTGFTPGQYRDYRSEQRKQEADLDESNASVDEQSNGKKEEKKPSSDT
ncbi:MAG: AraC family transcriptional regulator [Clostridiales bacterium]|nr:AraC family transcriptional regulator [Clostridiales bacterium]